MQPASRTVFRGDAYEFQNRLGPIQTARPAAGTLLDIGSGDSGRSAEAQGREGAEGKESTQGRQGARAQGI